MENVQQVKSESPEFRDSRAIQNLQGLQNQAKNTMRAGSLGPDTDFLQQCEAIKAILKDRPGPALTLPCHLLPGPPV